MAEKNLQVELESAQAAFRSTQSEHSNEPFIDSQTPSKEQNNSEDVKSALQEKLESKKKELVGCFLNFPSLYSPFIIFSHTFQIAMLVTESIFLGFNRGNCSRLREKMG